MAYEVKPNSGSLFVNEKKPSDAHPDFQGKIIISAELIRKLAGQGETITFDASGWKKTTGSGKKLLSLAIKEPYKKPESSGDFSYSDRHNPDYTPNYASELEPKPHRSGALVETDRGIAFTEYRQPPAPTPAPTVNAPPSPEKYLAALKDKIAKVQDSVQFQELYDKIKSDEVWAVFNSVPAIAQEAKNILAEYQKKFAPNILKEPSDLSDLISKIDVEFERLKLHPKAHCLERWGKSRQKLSDEELQIYLDELQIAQPIPPSDDFF